MRYELCYPKNFWEQFNQPLVRDLAWIYFAPNLVTSPKYAFLKLATPKNMAAVLNWLHDLDNQPSQVLADILERTTFKRLGLYCESLLEVISTLGYQHRACNLTLVERNVQIFQPGSKITAGELDFLMRDTHERLIHIEMACKFYLLNNNIKQPRINTPLEAIYAHCIGPNCADRLDKKWLRLHSHQLPIAHKKHTLEQLKQRLNITQKMTTPSMLFLKGSVFCHYRALQPVNAGINVHTHHIWVHVSQVKQALITYEKQMHTVGEPRWLVLNRLDWLAGPKATQRLFEQSDNIERLTELIHTTTQYQFSAPFLLQQLTRSDTHIVKGVKIMVVGDIWPNKQRAS